MGNKKEKKARKGKKYKIEVSRGSLFFGGFALFFVLVWIFVLGVLVGKGLIPEKVQKLSRFREEILGFKRNPAQEDAKEEILSQEIKEPDFEFPKKLSQKREAVSSAPPKKVRAKKAESANADKWGFTVQLASFDDIKKAEALVKMLLKKGCQAYTHKGLVNGKIYYRVRVGRFKSRAEAQDYKHTLRRLVGLNGFVCKAN